MPKGPPKSVIDRKRARKARLSERLQLPVMTRAKLERLKSVRRQPKTIDELEIELAQFKGASEAVRRSHRYYVLALHKVYETWIDLLDIADVQRDVLISNLNHKNPEKTKRGDALHVLLRTLIDYGIARREELTKAAYEKVRQAAWSRISRDAAVLRYAERIDLQADQFVDYVAETPGGLEQMAREEAAARRSDKVSTTESEEGLEGRPKTKVKPSDTEDVSADAQVQPRAYVPGPIEAPELKGSSNQASREVDDHPTNTPKWRYGKALKGRMLAPTLANREVILRVFIGADGRRTVRDAYQPSTAVIDDDEFARHMEGIEARLIAKGLRRPKV